MDRPARSSHTEEVGCNGDHGAGEKGNRVNINMGTHHISPKDSTTHHRRTQLGKANRTNMAYIVYAAQGEKGDEKGGIVIFLHEKWRHRVSKVKRHARGRWIHLTLMTPVGAVTIVGYYMEDRTPKKRRRQCRTGKISKQWSTNATPKDT
jgi:hypothetical protein